MKPIARLVPLALLLVAGCASSSSDTVKPLSPAVAKQSYVSDISIKSVPPNVSPEFKDTLLAALHDGMKKCATGDKPLRLNVTIALFSPQNVALTLLVGDSDKIKGTAQFVDPATDTVVGDYDIARSIAWGGIVAAAVMADAEGKMSAAFADEACKRAFTAGR